MATLVVTVAWQGRRRDLAVPEDVPVAELLRPLALALLVHRPTRAPGGDAGATPLPAPASSPAPAPSPAPPGGAGATPAPALGTWGDLALAPLGGAPLSGGRTLAACGIGDGAVLVLIDGSSLRPRARPAP